MGYKYTIDGLGDIQKAFAEKQKEINEVLTNAVGDGVDAVVASAKSKAPVGATHNLVNAIGRNEVWDRGGKIFAYAGIMVGGVFTKADGWYARMQEYGTSKMKAHPYLQPAFNELKASIKDKMIADIKEVLEK